MNKVSKVGWGLEKGPNYGCTEMNGFVVCGEEYSADGERMYCPEHLLLARGFSQQEIDEAKSWAETQERLTDRS